VTGGFRFRLVAGWFTMLIRQGRCARHALVALLALSLCLIAMVLSVSMLRDAYAGASDAAQQTAHLLNSQTSSGALIETYESELHFLLDRPYHYPPDQTHVDLNRRTFLWQDVPIRYDPLASNPDYLVVGPFGRLWRLYEPVLASGAFRLWQTIGPYEIYRRAH
jgi:hypothetical protein